MVPPDSYRIPRVPHYSGTRPGRQKHFTYGAVTLCGGVFQLLLLCVCFLTSRLVCTPTKSSPTTPDMQRVHAYTYQVWAVPVSLAATKGITLFSLPLGTKMFQFPRFATVTYEFSYGYHGFTMVGFPIRKSPDQCLLAAPRSLSQPTTSFIAY